MSDDDDMDFASTNQSSRNLASLFHGTEPGPAIVASTAAYVAPKQPKKDSPPKIMTASVVQAFVFADQKWTPRGKMGVAVLSTDNTLFQLILYLTKTQHVTSARITSSTVFTSQPNNYLSFQDDGGQNWSIMFDSIKALVDLTLQILLAKAHLLAFKFDHLVQEIREGEGSALVDNDSAEITVSQYKVQENGTLVPVDNGENKPVRYKIGKQQNGKAFDDCLRGMKKSGQRLVMIGNTLYNIEIVRIKREKEARASSITVPVEDQPIAERKRTITEDVEMDSEKNKLLQRVHKMGGVSMLPNQNQPSAFATPLPPHLSTLSDDDSIANEFVQNVPPPVSMPIQAPPVQFVPPSYHQVHRPPHPAMISQPNLYSPQQPVHDYNSRPGSSMGMTAMGYPQTSMWHPSQYPQASPNVPPPVDMFYQQSHLQNDVRQSITRLTEKVDTLNEKFDAKNSTSYPNMETSIVLANIQRIVKENDTMKKDVFDRSAKVEELNTKISELLDRNQKLIEQSHQTAEQRNVVVNNVSEQTAQKILDLEKQKVELTNSLSVATSKIADLQLQLNQYSQGTNESQSRISTLLHKCEQYKEELDKSESLRSETQGKLDTVQEQLKNEKAAKKQLQTNLNSLEEELAETKATCATLEKGNNERKAKYESERRRWQDDMDEQKQSYETELDELRNKLRKQRTADSLTTNQERSRMEEDFERQWQEKLDRQQAQQERLLTAKGKEFDQLKASFDENETKLQQVTEELNESKQQIETYEEQFEKLQERVGLMKAKLIELNEEQPQLINDEVKRAINIIFQRLKTRIRPSKQYTGEEFLSRALEVIKKATLKVLSNNDDDEQSSEDIQSEEEQEVVSEKNDQPSNGNSVDQQTLNEEVLSVMPSTSEEGQPETTSTSSQKNGWDTVDDLPEESKGTEQSQIVEVTEETSVSTLPADQTDPPVPVTESTETDGSSDTVEENEKEPPPTNDESDEEQFQSARPSIQEVIIPPANLTAPKYTFNENIPLMTNPDDSDDELFK